jgi:hypothetical protein
MAARQTSTSATCSRAPWRDARLTRGGPRGRSSWSPRSRIPVGEKDAGRVRRSLIPEQLRGNICGVRPQVSRVERESRRPENRERAGSGQRSGARPRFREARILMILALVRVLEVVCDLIAGRITLLAAGAWGMHAREVPWKKWYTPVYVGLAR